MKRLFILLSLVLLPHSAFAAEETVHEFLGGKKPITMTVHDLTGVAPTNEGLRISTTKPGRFIWENNLTHPVDALAIVYTSPQPIQGWFLWKTKSMDEKQWARIPVQIPAAPEGRRLEIIPSYFPEWERNPTLLGLGVSEGSIITIQFIQIGSWNYLEQIGYAWKSFWTYDQLRPYSINFLWGPLFTYTLPSLNQMFESFPPHAHSANRLFYIILALALIPLMIALWKNEGQAKAIRTFGFVFIALWLFFDFRMGTEVMSYLHDDYKTNWSKPVGERRFREHDHYYDFMEEAKDYVTDREHYIFMAPQRWPYLGLSRYLTYPAAPTSPDRADVMDTWVIFNRPDLTVNDSGQLMHNNQVATQPGKILYEMKPGTFVFRETR